MAKINTKIGDVFSVMIDDNNKKYFQLIAYDLTQLNSDVIRAFKKKYAVGSNQELMEILNDEIEFYAHCVTKLGIKMGYWEKIANVSNVGEINHILFRDTADYGNPQKKISQDWWVWKINEEQRRVDAIFDVAKDVGYPALPMDLWLSRALITSVAYKQLFEEGLIRVWDSKIYFNAIEHYMDDTTRPENLLYTEALKYDMIAVDLSRYATGTYVVNIKTDVVNTSVKVIKK